MALRSWHRKWLMTKWNMTANAIFNWISNSCFDSEDLHQILWFRAALLKKIIYCVLLCIIHAVNVLRVQVKNHKYQCQKLTRVQTFVCNAHQTIQILNWLHHRRITTEALQFHLHKLPIAQHWSQAARQGLAVLMASAVGVLKHETSTLCQSHNFISIDLKFGVGRLRALTKLV